jgi:hypothetical protein
VLHLGTDSGVYCVVLHSLLLYCGALCYIQVTCIVVLCVTFVLVVLSYLVLHPGYLRCDALCYILVCCVTPHCVTSWIPGEPGARTRRASQPHVTHVIVLHPITARERATPFLKLPLYSNLFRVKLGCFQLPVDRGFRKPFLLFHLE